MVVDNDPGISMSAAMQDAAEVDAWPAGDLEKVPECPVCGGGSGRDLWYGALRDRVFGIAPGAWSLYRCRGCGSGWLDPRPNAASLPRAYAGYFTHDEIRTLVVVRRRGLLRRWLHDLLNDYMNHRYATSRKPVATGGRWLAWLMPPLRAAVEATCRHLPPVPEEGGLLLDVGCGNGAFLRLAQEMGWQVEGVDFDPEAVQQARHAGLHVTTGGVEVLDAEEARYDVITMSHVIEHVPDPNDTLCRLYRLLKPGGMLWLETPNLASIGHRLYGKDWRDLDPPRHLVLFDPKSLIMMLSQAGFADFRQHWNALVSFEILRISRALHHGHVTGSTADGKPPFTIAFIVEAIEAALPARREFLTFTARKPRTT